MHLLALALVGLVIGGVWGHTVEVLTEPCPTLSINQDRANYDPPEPTYPESSIIAVEGPTTVEVTVLSTVIESEQATPCDTTESALPTVPYESVPESVYYHPPIESDDVTTSPVDPVTPCDTTQTSSPTVLYEPVTEPVYHAPSIFITETTSPSQHVQTIPTESQTPCTESSADAPIHYSEPEPVPIQSTTQIYKALEPSKNDVPHYHPPVSIPLSEPVHPPVDKPTVIFHTQPAPSSFKTFTSIVPTPTPTELVVELDLRDATLGLYATFIEIDGRRAIRLAPPPNCTASFTIEVDEEADFPLGSFVTFEASITVGDICPNTKRRAKIFERADRNDKIQVIKDNKKLVNKEIKKTNDKIEKLKSNKSMVGAGRAAYEILQNGGSNSLSTTFNDASIRSS